MSQWVPRSRLNEVIKERNDYKEEVKELKVQMEKLNEQWLKMKEKTIMDERSLKDLLKIYHLTGHLMEKVIQDQRNLSKER